MNLAELNSRYKYRTYAIVTGADVDGLFDMMRYEAATFAMWNEAANSITQMILERERQAFLISRGTDSKRGLPPWAFDRWESFGFTCCIIDAQQASDIKHGHKAIEQFVYHQPA